METINVVFLFVHDKVKGVWKESDLTSYTGNVWWDYIEVSKVSVVDWNTMDIHSLYYSYHQ
jgi:hypothetical protein